MSAEIAKPCLGGRYRIVEAYFGDVVIIQCNCDFFCTSRRKRLVYYPEDENPYYYIPTNPQPVNSLSESSSSDEDSDED